MAKTPDTGYHTKNIVGCLNAENNHQINDLQNNIKCIYYNKKNVIQINAIQGVSEENCSIL